MDAEQQKAQIKQLMSDAERAAERVKKSEESFKSLVEQAHNLFGYEIGGDRSNVLNQVLGAAYHLGHDAGQSSEVVMHQREEIAFMERLLAATEEQQRRSKEREAIDDERWEARDKRDAEQLELSKRQVAALERLSPLGLKAG